jgi:two-component system, cell cycle sensor histidine kinase and response regulator CckA
MSTPLRTVVVERDSTVGDAIQRELNRLGFEAECQLVDSESGFASRLDPPPALIFFGNCQDFNCVRGLQMARERGLATPFIGILEQDAMTSETPQGLAGWVGKDRLAELGPLVTDAFHQARGVNLMPGGIGGLNDTLFRDLVERSLAGIYVIQDGRYVYVNPKLAEVFGYTVPEVLAMKNWIELISAEDRAMAAEQVRRRFSGEVTSAHYVYRGRRKDGAILDAEVLGNTTMLNGRLAVVGTLLDISERRLRSEQLRAEEERFRSAFDLSGVPMVLTDLEHRFVRANTAFANLFGYSPEEILKLTMPAITHPDDLTESFSRRQGLLSGEVSFFQMEKRYLHKDGRLIWGLTNVSLIRDAQGLPKQYVGQVQDITERKRAEEQLRQAQKMEAVGQLAGGIAHDFNNLLTIICGYGELLLQQMSPSNPVRAGLEQIYKAGERATMLTRQLLAFSRREVIEPKLLDVNHIITDAERMLRRILGEDISLSTALSANLPRIKADLGQIEQVLLNLCVNARDAMPRGGRLTIETALKELDEEYAQAHVGVRAGRYVMIAVSDTGCGMNEATKARIFEPFFTTKGVGKGTGLGLSTVFGIVKQAGGHIWVYSEVNRGTTFKVYFPAIDFSTESGRAATPAPMVRGGTETVLLLEDDAAVRVFAGAALRAKGYTVLEAAGASDAIRLAQGHPGAIDLLVTDVVMPEMGGREAAERMKALRPSLKVLYVSGYTDDAVIRHGVLAAEMAFLQKPFAASALTGKVREVLDQSPPD